MNDVKTLADLFGNHRDAWRGRLEVEAREAWGDDARGKRWTVWLRFSFAALVSEKTADSHIRNWATQLRTLIPGAALMVGLHTDTSRRHAHGLLFLPRRLTDPHYPPGISIVGWSWEPWLQLVCPWRPGLLWAACYDRSITDRTKHGAGHYLAKDPGSVMQFGTAPPEFST